MYHPVCLKTVKQNMSKLVTIRSVSQLTSPTRIVLMEFFICGLERMTMDAIFPAGTKGASVITPA